jgi:hypothetical protein
MDSKSVTLKEIQEKYECRRAFEVLIDDKPYQVWNINDYEHESGKMNGTPSTWWIEYSGELIPFVDKGIHRICWEINYKQKNTSKYKWDSWNFRSSGYCTIKANGKEIYTFGSFDLAYALAKAQTMLVQLLEHPYNFLNPAEMKDRKIWYYGLPATVMPSSSHPGEISVNPDLTEISKEDWWKLYKERKSPISTAKLSTTELEDLQMDSEDAAEWMDYGSIGHGDALWDGMIDWFRGN